MNFPDISKKLVSQNISINVLGNLIPMILAIFCIPLIINGIGNEKFGILSIAWLFLGYFSILDLGIGRATTKFVIEYSNKGLIDEVKSLIFTSIFSLIIFGGFIGLVLLILTPIIITDFLNIPTYLQAETHQSFYAICFSIPFVIGVAGVRGVLEAQQKFRLLNVIKIPASILNYLIPAVVVIFSDSVFLIIFLLMVMRALLLLVYAFYCFRPFRGTKSVKIIQGRLAKKLVSYGGWLTISNLVGPVMVYFDRFIIGSILTLTLLTYYSTPYEVITKLLVIAGSATGVLFPVFTSLYLQDDQKLEDIYNKSLKGILFILFPITLFVACFSFEILLLWLGKDFSENSSVVLVLLSLGVLWNSISAIPFTALQALNRPDITAKVHVIELPFYIVALLFLAQNIGIVGVALAWMLRSLLDAIVFLVIYKNLAKTPAKYHQSKTTYLLIFCCLCFLGAYVLTIYGTWLYKLPYFISILIVFYLAFWTHALNSEEKNMVTAFFKRLHG